MNNNQENLQTAEKQKKTWMFVSLALAVALGGSLIYNASSRNADQGETTATIAKANDDEEVLQSWTDDAASKTALVNFVTNAVDEDSAGYIPEENRIAVFDADGTLMSETAPYYFEWMMLFDRVDNDPDYKAPAEIQSYVDDGALQAVYDGNVTDEIDYPFAAYRAKIYEGMTMDEFNDYVQNWLKTPVDGFDGMTYGTSFYEPMKEVVEYLNDNDFTVYCVSGTDRELVRDTICDELGIDRNHVIASDATITATNQNGEDGEFYTFTADDEVLRGGESIIKNLKMNKVSAITREIGIQPVLAFGNSSGDESMLTYTITNNEYLAEAFMLLCDDTERDYGNEEKAASCLEMCEKDGFNAVSMRDDFATIYGDDVTKTQIDNYPKSE